MTAEKKDDSATREENAIKTWNGKLVALSDSFRSKHPGVTTSIFSTYDVFNKVLDHPEAFPQTAVLKNTKEFCAGYARLVVRVLMSISLRIRGNANMGDVSSTPESLTKPANGCKYALTEYFWVNNLHPTSPVHDATAAELGKFLAANPANNGKKCGFVDGSASYGGTFAKRGRWRV
jgi:hypothetical protein